MSMSYVVTCVLPCRYTCYMISKLTEKLMDKINDLLCPLLNKNKGTLFPVDIYWVFSVSCVW